MILKKLKEFLDSHNEKYSVVSHSLAYTAEEIANVSHVPRKDMAKTVVVNIDNKPAIVVLPASHMIDFKMIKRGVGAEHVSLASETEFNALFPDCEVGAMPPFGNLFDMKTLAADVLSKDEYICFNAGTHRELIKLAYQDFIRLVNPVVMPLSVERKHTTEDQILELM
jgi:Ala-tRNA(Pro) deacylase